MLRKILCPALAGIALAAGAFAGEALSLDEVLSRYYEAMGGLERIRGLESMRASGTMTMGQGMEAPFTMSVKRPGMARLEFTFQGMTAIQAYDGETAWMVMPFMGKTEPEVMPEDQARQMKEEADIEGPLVDWREKGHQITFLGEEEVEGTAAYKLKLVREGGDVEYYFLDAEYFLPIKVASKRTIQGNEVELESTISDYKEVAGLMLAHSIEMKPKGGTEGQTITIEAIELDAEIPDEEFHMPEPAAAEAVPPGR